MAPSPGGAVARARAAFDLSERRAGAALGFDRSSMRYGGGRGDDADLRGRPRALAGQRRRFGWRRLKILLAREGIAPTTRGSGASTPRSGELQREHRVESEAPQQH